MPLRSEQIERYSRQIILPEVGARGQERLVSATAALFGTGSLARLCAQYLAGAGLGEIGLDPFDDGCDAAGRALATDLVELNPSVRIERLPRSGGPDTSLLSSPAPTPLERYELWVDACGATLACPQIATMARAMRRPLLAAGVHGSQGWLAHQSEDGTGCVVCAALHEGQEGAGSALDASAAGVVASLLAFEVLTRALGWNGREDRLHYDGATLSLRPMEASEHPKCVVCRQRNQRQA